MVPVIPNKEQAEQELGISYDDVRGYVGVHYYEDFLKYIYYMALPSGLWTDEVKREYAEFLNKLSTTIQEFRKTPNLEEYIRKAFWTYYYKDVELFVIDKLSELIKERNINAIELWFKYIRTKDEGGKVK